MNALRKVGSVFVAVPRDRAGCESVYVAVRVQ